MNSLGICRAETPQSKNCDTICLSRRFLTEGWRDRSFQSGVKEEGREREERRESLSEWLPRMLMGLSRLLGGASASSKTSSPSVPVPEVNFGVRSGKTTSSPFDQPPSPPAAPLPLGLSVSIRAGDSVCALSSLVAVPASEGARAKTDCSTARSASL